MKKQLTKLALAVTIVLAFIFIISCGKHGWEYSAEDEELFSSSSSQLDSSSSSSSPVANVSSDSHPGVVVAPLTKTKWAQGSPYNDLFPMVNGSRKVTDCVTTAMVQIMAFHKHPARGMGESSVVGPTSSSFPSVTVPLTSLDVAYDWDNMLNEYTSRNPGNEQQRSAVATLMYHFGLVRDKPSILYAMVGYFGYDNSIQSLYRKNYSDAEWEAIIRQQLDLGLPVFYHGTSVANDDEENFSVESGHGFVVDGYDNAGKFHINTGWSGRYDGWYSLNDIDLGEGRRYNYNNHIYINIKPDACIIVRPDVSGIVSDTLIDSRNGKKYRTVKIGEQVWMAENLNIKAGNYRFNAKYGLLYDWATAMELPSTYNSTLYSAAANHRGICPTDWHLPSNEEWEKLLRYVDGTSGTASPYQSKTAGKYLKAQCGWNENGNGTDNFGFFALPGSQGRSYRDVGLGNFGKDGYWWSSSEVSKFLARARNMVYDKEVVNYGSYSKEDYMFSVRCIKD